MGDSPEHQSYYYACLRGLCKRYKGALEDFLAPFFGGTRIIHLSGLWFLDVQPYRVGPGRRRIDVPRCGRLASSLVRPYGEQSHTLMPQCR